MRVTVGRQEIKFDDERVVGAVNWSNPGSPVWTASVGTGMGRTTPPRATPLSPSPGMNCNSDPTHHASSPTTGRWSYSGNATASSFPLFVLLLSRTTRHGARSVRFDRGLHHPIQVGVQRLVAPPDRPTRSLRPAMGRQGNCQHGHCRRWPQRCSWPPLENQTRPRSVDRRRRILCRFPIHGFSAPTTSITAGSTSSTWAPKAMA